MHVFAEADPASFEHTLVLIKDLFVFLKVGITKRCREGETSFPSAGLLPQMAAIARARSGRSHAPGASQA